MNAGYVYVIAFDNGTVKVGRTQNHEGRLKAHKSDARKFSVTVARSWMSPFHVEWKRNEDALKAIAAKCGGTASGAEYFTGANYVSIVCEAAGLPFTPPQAVAEVAEPEAPKGPRELTRGQQAVRDAALQAKAKKDAWKAETACFFIDGGVTPEFMRERLRAPYIADVMKSVLREEAEIRRPAST